MRTRELRDDRWPGEPTTGEPWRRVPVIRAEVRATPCPRCDADAGEPCRGVRGQPRTSYHRDRWQAAAPLTTSPTPGG